MKVNFDNNYKFQPIEIKNLQNITRRPVDELLIGGGGGEESIFCNIIDWIGKFLWWTLCFPCALINCLFGAELQDDEKIQPVPTPIRLENTALKSLFFLLGDIKSRPNNWDTTPEYYDQITLLLKGITFELKKLEKEMEKPSPDLQKTLKEKIRGYLQDLNYGAGKCGPGKYNAALSLYRKLANCSESLYDRFLFFIQEIKEQFIMEYYPIEIHEFNVVRRHYGEDLGLNRNPILLKDPLAQNRVPYQGLKYYQALFNKNFTKDWLFDLLLMNVNNETDVNKHLYTEFMYNYLDNDPNYLAIFDKKNWTQNEADAYTVQFQTKEGLTKKAIGAFFESIQDENGHKISDLFDPSGAIDWNIMKRVPKNIDLEESTKNIPSNIQPDDLLTLWEKVK